LWLYFLIFPRLFNLIFIFPEPSKTQW
jgi:hypothetical protein